MNERLAAQTLSALLDHGVTEYCVCPGARNAPLIAALAANESALKSYYFYDERSAAFFALGRMRASGKPVAVVTTSGTAVGELMPAAMEAHYSGLPLVLLTADRPRRFRQSGAPQAAEQAGIFGIYAVNSLDLAESESWPAALAWDRLGALHVNVCFEEPLLDPRAVYSLSERRLLPARSCDLAALALQTEACSALAQAVSTLQHPLVIVAALSAEDRPSARKFLLAWGAPVYFEALSGLREDPAFESIRIHSGDKLIERAHESGYPVDGVIRLGGVPTLRTWRDLEDKFLVLPVLSASRLPFTGLGRNAPCASGDLSALLGSLGARLPGRISSILAFQGADRERKLALTRLLADEPRSEPGLFRQLSERIPERARVYLGNSLPIREWDLAAGADERNHEVYASRGLNGIDGQVSTFLGLCEENRENWGVFGDLTALYDLSGPWALSQLGDARAQLVVVNNGGGKIFDRMFKDTRFQNNHALQFGPWAALWGLEYERWEEIPAVVTAPSSRIVEIVPDAAATERFWKRYSAL